MSISFYFYLFLIAVLSVVVSLGGSRWIERLYQKNKDILTFPDDVVSRGQWRPYLLGIAFLACGVRFFFSLPDCHWFSCSMQRPSSF